MTLYNWFDWLVPPLMFMTAYLIGIKVGIDIGKGK